MGMAMPCRTVDRRTATLKCDAHAALVYQSSNWYLERFVEGLVDFRITDFICIGPQSLFVGNLLRKLVLFLKLLNTLFERSIVIT